MEKVFLEAEVVEQQEGAYRVKLDDGFSGAQVWVDAKKLVRRVPDDAAPTPRVVRIKLTPELLERLNRAPAGSTVSAPMTTADGRALRDAGVGRLIPGDPSDPV